MNSGNDILPKFSINPGRCASTQSVKVEGSDASAIASYSSGWSLREALR